MITSDQLRRICPLLDADKAAEYTPLLLKACAEAQIDSTLRLAAFLAQIAHECGCFRYREEIWGPTKQQLKYEPPSSLALTLGNTEPGDGHRFRGRGWIQITGRENYRKAGAALNLPLEDSPELASEPVNAFRIAAWYWHSRNLNALADAGDMRGITRKINGGLTGLADRLKRYEIARDVLEVAE